jgi:hypothetical protein
VTEKKEQPELYNLKEDPFEKTDLSAKSADTVVRLRKRLDEWWRGK